MFTIVVLAALIKMQSLIMASLYSKTLLLPVFLGLPEPLGFSIWHLQYT